MLSPVRRGCAIRPGVGVVHGRDVSALSFQKQPTPGSSSFTLTSMSSRPLPVVVLLRLYIFGRPNVSRPARRTFHPESSKVPGHRYTIQHSQCQILPCWSMVCLSHAHSELFSTMEEVPQWGLVGGGELLSRPHATANATCLLCLPGRTWLLPSVPFMV